MVGRHLGLMSLTIGISLVSAFGCNVPGGGINESGSGGGSIVMAAPNPLPPFESKKTQFTYLLKCDGDAEGTHKETPKPEADIEFKNVKVSKGVQCTVQMATDVSKIKSSEFDFATSSTEGGLTVVYEGLASTEAAPAESQGLVLNVTLSPKYVQPDGAARTAIIPFTLTDADKNLDFGKGKFSLACGQIANFGACTKRAADNAVKCEEVSKELRSDCSLTAVTSDGKVTLISKLFVIAEGKANEETKVSAVELVNQAKVLSGPVKVNATIKR